MSLAPAILLAAAFSAAPDRVGIVVGSNDGGGDRAALWFAESDAARVAGVLSEVGGFAPGAMEVLRTPSATQFRAALKTLERRVRAIGDAGRVPMILLYFSGHADPLGLRLGAERVPYPELSAFLRGLPGGPRIAIVDACHSGALTQEKGASPAPLDFDVPQVRPAEGIAILTSASAGEAAQESTAIRGSFFTHHLTQGLRGPADGDGDGRVTLGEAFRFAYGRTLAATSGAGVPAQHPTYAMRLSGHEEVVLADLRESRSGLAFAAGDPRRFVVTRADATELVAEFDVGLRPVVLALPPGRYRLERTEPSPPLGGPIQVPPLGLVAVDELTLSPLPVVQARAKGLEPRLRAYAQLHVGTPMLSRFGAALGVGLGIRGSVRGFSARAGAIYEEREVDDDGLRYRYRGLGFTGAAGFELALARAALQLGLQGSATLAEQRFSDGSTSGDVIWGGGPYAAAVLPLGPTWGIRLDVEGSANRFRLNDHPTLVWTARGSMALERAF